MKQLLVTLTLLVSSFFVSAQSYYKAVMTELYVYNKVTDEWDLYQKNSDVNITVVVEEEFVNFQANSPTMYKIYTSTKKPFTTQNFKGYSYTAKDLKKDNLVVLDILGSETSDYFLVSIVNKSEGVNMRFYMKKVN
jgi:hypothetical protein